MAALVAVLLGAGLVLPGASIAARSSAPAPRTEAAPAAAVPDSVARTGRVLVRWVGDRSALASSRPARVRAIGAATGGAATFVRVTASGAAVYDLGNPLGGDAQRTLERLRRVPGVAFVEPDLWMTATDLPNDAYAAQLWGLLDGGLSSSPRFGIDAQSAWATTTGTGIVVAVIDTGILFGHPDLVGQTVAGWDFVSHATIANDGQDETSGSSDRDSDPADPGDWVTEAENNGGVLAGCPATNSSWHGSHVAGTIAAKANNTIGVFGAAPGVKIQPVRVLGKCGGFVSDIGDAIVWASGGTVAGVPANATPAKILNISLGGNGSCPFEYSSAISGARSRGSVVVVAAGNGSENASNFAPANCANVVTVAAIGQDGKKASFSNFGAVVELAGPGVGIYSTINNGTQGPNPAGYTYSPYNGTSMATPHVTATAALIASVDPLFESAAIEELLTATAMPFATDPGSTKCPAACGAGSVYARRAMEVLAGPKPFVGPIRFMPTAPDADTPVTVSARAWDLSDVAGGEIQVDGGPWVAATSADGGFGESSERFNATVGPLWAGSHRVCVRATDPAANSSGSRCRTLTIGGGPPAG